ncbi:phage portal protein [Tetragenococcus halophilus]|uniref:phage portal protein n=1 Tax=Tetragenococcus halophilus TaxID=51669 RepID=UPI0030C95CD0
MNAIVKFGSWRDLFKRNKELADLVGMDGLTQDAANRAYLKNKALDININYVARTLSQSVIRLKDKDESVKTDWHYKLNVRPNTDLSASDFWQRFFYELIRNNEVLAVQTDTYDFVIADSFVRKEYALYPDVFESVVVKDYQFRRPFYMDDVIYLSYNNKDLDEYTTDLFGDYGELFGRMLDSSLRSNQIRGTVEVGTVSGTEEQKIKKLQNFIDRLFNGFKKPVSIVPVSNGLEYNELSDGTKQGQTFDETNQVQKAMVTEVAKLIGVPPSLIHGETADQDSAQEMYIKYCINPLLKKLEDELNAKILSKRQVSAGKHFEVLSLNRPKPTKDIVEDSSNIDKIIASGTMNRNEIRALYGLPPVEGGYKFVMTKNYSNNNNSETKGGETDNDETTNQGDDNSE